MSRELLGQFDLFSSSEIKRTKVCSRCKQRLDVENFYLSKGRFNSFCIKCAKKYQNEYNKDNKKTLNRKYQEMCSTEEGAIRVMFVLVFFCTFYAKRIKSSFTKIKIFNI